MKTPIGRWGSVAAALVAASLGSPAVAAAKILHCTEDQVNSTIALCASLASSNLEGPRSGGRALREGAAVLIADRDLTPERLAVELRELCAGRGKLLAMAERARLVAKPRAAEDLAAACLEQLEAA